MSRVIFLDIDGVLWTREPQPDKSWNHPEIKNWERLNPSTLAELDRILASCSDLRIVISSSWRYGRPVAWFKEHFKACGSKVAYRYITHKTPSLRGAIDNVQRGHEIQAWLDEHPTNDFIILDDDSDMLHFLNTEHFIKTKFDEGLNAIVADKVISYFNRSAP